MRSSTLKALAMRVSGAFLALLASGLVALPEARADCGHYVVSRSGSATVLDQLDLLHLDREFAAPAGQAPFKGQRVPCSGALCSGSPAIPLAPPVLLPVRTGQWAICTFTPPSSNLGSMAMAWDETPAHINPLASSVFHPPR